MFILSMKLNKAQLLVNNISKLSIFGKFEKNFLMLLGSSFTQIFKYKLSKK